MIIILRWQKWRICINHMRLIKTILRKIKRFLVAILGSKIDELYWCFRHISDKEWTKGYISDETIQHPHRKFLIEKISKYYPFDTVLEIGCASGPNLYILAKKFPEGKIYGIDISKRAIEEGKKYFGKGKIKNVFLHAGGIKILKDFQDKSADIVFTDAVLIYFDKHKIEIAIKEILRVARKAVIFFELHHDLKDSIYKDNWIHNYKLLLSRFVPEKNIKAMKIPSNLWGEIGKNMAIS